MLNFDVHDRQLRRIAALCVGNASVLAAAQEHLAAAAVEAARQRDALRATTEGMRRHGFQQGPIADAPEANLRKQVEAAEAQVAPLVNAAAALDEARVAVEAAMINQTTIRDWWTRARVMVENAYRADRWWFLHVAHHQRNAYVVSSHAIREAEQVNADLTRSLRAATQLMLTAS
jgi:hypothetical protein